MDVKAVGKAGVAVSRLLEAIAETVPKIARIYHEQKCSVCPKNKTDEPAERLEAIWNKLSTFHSDKRHRKLLGWAETEIGFKYYGRVQKHPMDLCEHIRDHLRDLNEKHLAELEAILE